MVQSVETAYDVHVTRRLGETDDELRERVVAIKQRLWLRDFLTKLKIKADLVNVGGITVNTYYTYNIEVRPIQVLDRHDVVGFDE